MKNNDQPIQAPVFDGEYYVVQAPMTRALKLRGHDLTVFAIIHSFTKDGKHLFRGSAKYIAEKWLEPSAERAIKDSLKSLADAGFINVIKEGSQNAYTTNYNSLLERIQAGEEIPTLGRKNRSKKQTVVPYHPLLAQGADNTQVTKIDSGTVPPPEKSADSGTVPPKQWYRTTPDSGTVPPQINIENNKSILLGARTDARAREEQEEKEEILEIFFLRNAANPRREVERFYEYNERNGWNDGRLDTTDKRRRMAKVNWKFETENRRFPEDFLDCWGAIQLAAKMSDPAIARAMLDDRISFSGTPGESCMITCPAEVVPWIEKDKKIIVKLMPLKKKYGNITYRTIK